MGTELSYCECGANGTERRPTRHHTDLTTFPYVSNQFIKFVMRSFSVVNSSYSVLIQILLVSATLSVLPIRLEPDLLVSTAFQLYPPVCSRIQNVFGLNI